MKKILIVNNNLHIGGVQKALVNLLQEIADYKDIDVTLLLFSVRGTLVDRIPAGIHVITPSFPFRCWGLTKNDRASLAEKALRAVLAGITRIFGRAFALKLVYPFQKKIGYYDVALSYLHSVGNKTFYGGCCEFVLNCVEAKKKVAFLHCDYEKIGADCPENTTLYAGFDMIAACSYGSRSSFLQVLPQFADKTVVISNCQDYKHLSGVSVISDTKPNKPLCFITVARFGKEKGILRAIRAVSRLGEKRDRLQYGIVGSGAEFPDAKELVNKLGLESVIKLYGEIPEPYEFMRSADVLLIPSFSEAAPLVIGEAAAIGIPILSTETSSAKEMVEETGYGWVCDNSEVGIRDAMCQLLDHPEYVKERAEFLADLKLDNTLAVKQFLAVLD